MSDVGERDRDSVTRTSSDRAGALACLAVSFGGAASFLRLGFADMVAAGVSGMGCATGMRVRRVGARTAARRNDLNGLKPEPVPFLYETALAFVRSLPIQLPVPRRDQIIQLQTRTHWL